MNKKEETKIDQTSRNNNEWNRTFNNQNNQYTINIGMIVTAWALVTISIVGIVFWLLTKMI